MRYKLDAGIVHSDGKLFDINIKLMLNTFEAELQLWAKGMCVAGEMGGEE